MNDKTSAQSAPDLPGMRFVELIGSGGFADVYLYERERPRMRVAVKLIKSSVLDDVKRRQFAAEADAMAELAEHPYIVPVLGAGTSSDGRPYLMMRYYPSSDLAVRVATTPMSVPDALRYGVQLSSAVETAHRAGIIHRDIKPSNILISSYGQPGLSDFGIAGRPGDAAEADDEEMGVSIPWSPPEVLTGASNGSVTSDVYSLAATVWNLLVGRAPFYLPGGDNGERATFTRIVHSRPPSTGRDDVPASLDRLLQQSLAKDPAHRPQSALEMARHFQRIEQELRLARTEIVVLDQATVPAPAATPTTSSEHADTEPEVAAKTQMGTGPRGGAATTHPDVGVDREPDTDADTATELRAPKRVGSVQAAPASSVAPTSAPTGAAAPRRTRAAAEESRPTELRPRNIGPIQPDASEQDSDASRRWFGGRGLLIAVAVVVIIAAVSVGALLSRGGGPTKNAGDPPSTSVDTDPNDVAPASQDLTDPGVIRGKVEGNTVLFTWTPVTGANSYSWTPDYGSGAVVTKPSARVPAATKGPTCITVRSLGKGVAASPGKRQCVK